MKSITWENQTFDISATYFLSKCSAWQIDLFFVSKKDLMQRLFHCMQTRIQCNFIALLTIEYTPWVKTTQAQLQKLGLLCKFCTVTKMCGLLGNLKNIKIAEVLFSISQALEARGGQSQNLIFSSGYAAQIIHR